MELWVRGQEKSLLKKVSEVLYEEMDEHSIVTFQGDDVMLLGIYKTKERCLEIIDEIQKLLLSANPKEAFMLVDCRNENEFSHICSLVDFAREHNFIAYDGEDGTSFQLIQPSVLVYEMPKE